MKTQRKVYIIAGGVTKFAKAHPDMDFRLMVKKAFDYAMKQPDKPTIGCGVIIDGRAGYFIPMREYYEGI